jgi:hypothetical protein
MTIHYHGGPFTPRTVLYELAGECFCVSFSEPRDAAAMHQIGQSVMHDNGAYSVWRKTKEPVADWASYYRWVEPFLGNAVHWAVIPDEIDAGTQAQDYLVRQWPFGHRGAPVWHMDEPIRRLLELCDTWSRVCIGSTAEYAIVGSDDWRDRMDEAFNELSKGRRFLPWLHMLRGMQCSRWEYPFASVDSTDVAQNHHRARSYPGSLLPEEEIMYGAKMRAQRWNTFQCPDTKGPRNVGRSLCDMQSKELFG